MKKMQHADPRSLPLQFLNVSHLVFSESCTEKKEETKIELALIDASTGEIISSVPIFVKVEIVLLNGDSDMMWATGMGIG